MTLHITNNLLAQAVRAHRESRGFSLGALAENAGISKMSLSKIEAGLGNPSLDVLCRIASALHVPVGTLFGEESRPQLQVIRRDEGHVIISADLPHSYTSMSGARILSDAIPSRSGRLAMKSLPHIRHLGRVFFVV